MLALSYSQFNPHLIVGCWTTVCFVLFFNTLLPWKISLKPLELGVTSLTEADLRKSLEDAPAVFLVGI